ASERHSLAKLLQEITHRGRIECRFMVEQEVVLQCVVRRYAIRIPSDDARMDLGFCRRLPQQSRSIRVSMHYFRRLCGQLDLSPRGVLILLDKSKLAKRGNHLKAVRASL